MNMRLHISFITLFVSCFFTANAQDNFLKDYAPVAPNAASLGKYGDIPVSYHTGVPDISIPIHTLSEGSISVPISLSYHASGIRVQETASWVGLGWALNAGGVITRTVQGAPDENGSSGNGNQAWGWFANKGTGRYMNGVCQPPSLITDGEIDTEPDMFSFNVGGYAGKFFYDNDTIVRVVPQQDLKVVTVKIGNELFSGWIIIDPQGNRYHFGATDANMQMANYVEQNIYTDDPFSTPKNSSWYLSKIESADRKDVITFTYIEEKYAFWEVSTAPWFGGQISSQFPGNCNGPTVRKPTRARIKGKRLSQITGLNGSISFVGETNPRTDLSRYEYCAGNCSPVNTEAKALKLIEIKDKNGNCLKQFEFSTGYTPTSPLGSLPSNLLPDGSDSTDRKRLILNSLTEKACGSGSNNKTHSFEYYNLNSLPRRISFAQDHWGYYNGKDNNTDLDPGLHYYKRECNDCLSNYNHLCTAPPNKREPAFPSMQNGTLKKISYPTGGSSSFEYESHTIWGADSTCTETTILDWSAFGGGNCNNCTNCSSAYSERSYSFSQNQIDNGHISISIGTSCPGNSANIEVYNPSNQLVTSISNTGYWYLKSMNGVSLQPGITYRFKLNMQGSEPAFARIYTVVRSVFQTNKTIGGLRIKKITTDDGDTDVNNNVVKNYEYIHPLYGGQSSGKLVHLPIYKSLFENWCTYVGDPDCTDSCDWPLNNAYSLPGICPTNGSDPIVYLVAHSSALQPMQTTMGSHIGYLGVQVKETNNGKTEYKFEMGEYANGPWEPTGYPFPPPPYDPLVGKLISETHYNQSGTPQKSLEYEYLSDTINAVSEYEACKAIKLVSSPSATIAARFYNLNTGYALIKKTYERTYNADNTYQEKITDIAYSTANGHLQKTTEDITDADGTIYRTKFKYAKDFACPTSGACDETNANANAEGKAILAMRKRNMVAIPIEQTTWVNRPAWGAFRLTGATYFRFDKVNTDYNNLKLLEVYQVRPATPMTNFTEATMSTSGVFSKNGNYALEYNFRFSDQHGRLLSQWKENDPAKQQYIWSHNNKLPIAKIINAEDTEVAFTSFEQADNAYQGGWSFPGTGGGYDAAAGNFVSGRVGFNLSPARTVVKNSLPAGKYVVSGWHKDGSFVVNGTTVSVSTGGQWKYAEREVTLASPGNITVSSAGSDWGQFIDELRLCPSDALIRTFSFDDRSGLLLSIGDENSVLAHYEYDSWQRLQALRDQDRNILQTYEYNYQQAGAALNDIKSRTVLKSGQTTIAQVNALVDGDVKRVFQYMDGLGRPIQTNEVGQSPTEKDIITHQAYDALGREPKKFIPYTIASNNGTYRTAAATEQTTFANTWGAGGYGYAETKFEASPLNRPSEQGNPGATWRIGNGKTLEYAYRGNTVADAVRNFTGNNTFAANALWVTQETDENERKKWTFTDKLGRVVLVKQELNATETAQTYTIYDDFGRVAFVIPPETTKKMLAPPNNWDPNHANYASMIFKYVYDSRGRMISKTVPSGGTTTIAYDRLDRPVLTTDAKGFKVFTRYDILSRPIVSGKYKGTASPAGTNPLFETSNTTAPHYYTSTSFPTDNNLDVYKVFYYDDYDIDNNGSLSAAESYTDPAESGYETAAFLRTRGKPTASKTGILKTDGTAPTVVLTTRTYYDKEYSVIQVNKQNHLSGADITSSAYDFANRVTKTRRDHTGTPPGGSQKTYYIREEYTYDEAGRLRFTRHHVKTTAGAPTSGWVVTSAPVYDELNRLADKRLHASNYDGINPVALGASFNYLQSLDYTYNIRGWLTGINDAASCALQGGDQLADLFNMGLDYESTANGATAQYNGNIAAMQWRTNVNGSCLTRQQYRFTYDYANRLLTANHFTHNGTAWVNTNNYSESNIAYDLNGNIKTYTRRGLTAPATFGIIDQLTYTYGDAARPDRLTNVSDAGSAAKGFKFTSGAAAYTYDLNGNLTQDNHKSLSFQYNYLNLPNYITNPGGSEITITYTADGEKLSKTSPTETRNYVSGIEYLGNALDAIYYGEGRCTPNGATAFYYEYTIKDHLGNARINFRANGAAVTFLQELHYYPFGMLMEGIGTAPVTNNGYKYNYKELNEDLGLNLSDYGARWYDASLGRWWSVDPLAEKYQDWSGYNYGIGNPISTIDPNGMDVVAINKEDRDYLLGLLNGLLGDKGGKIFSFKNGYLKVNKNELKKYSKNAEVSQEQKDIAEGFRELAKNQDVRIEFKTVKDENEKIEFNPLVPRGKDSNDETIYGPLYTGKNSKGVVFTLSGAGATLDEGGNNVAIVVMNRKAAESETYTTNSEDVKTNPCASCVMSHEFLDHALPYARNPNRIFNGGEGITNHNKALIIKNSPIRNGKDHDERKSIKRF